MDSSPQPSDRAVLATEMRLAGAPSEDRTMDVVASTDALDSHGTVLDQASWDLARFIANPVVLYAHNQRDLPVGFAENVRVENGALHARLRFVTAAANPLAEQVWQLVQQKALRAVSVGFFAGDAKTQKRDGRDVAVLSGNELLEISVVPVPSNPEAVAKMRARAIADTTPTAPAADGAIPMADKISKPEVSPTVDASAAQVREFAARENAERELGNTRAQLAETAAALDAALADVELAHIENAKLRDKLGSVERLALLAEGRAAGKLSPAHLDAETAVGGFLATLTAPQLRAYLETKAREVPRSDARPPRPMQAKAWDAMSPSEKARLYHDDRATYDVLKAAAGQ